MVSSDLLCHIDLGMQYQDDEADRVILATDNDLMNAITYARSSGAKVLCSLLVQLFVMLFGQRN
mgnify:CR=1 FL=1